MGVAERLQWVRMLMIVVECLETQGEPHDGEQRCRGRRPVQRAQPTKHALSQRGERKLSHLRMAKIVASALQNHPSFKQAPLRYLPYCTVHGFPILLVAPLALAVGLPPLPHKNTPPL